METTSSARNQFKMGIHEVIQIKEYTCDERQAINGIVESLYYVSENNITM